ncbi:uncharacterized protein LOC119641441 [Glossina fuscipes]|uniref:Uncharacterized protein LOC119641441 n=2 Tax=Nemorhina TaxID=44051 RepID=A0A9C6DY77_9MUSC|nr:uncharacterized protein LOC119641441 [Glossina fuscipes]
MDLNTTRLRTHSLDDEDTISGNSRTSYGGFPNSVFNSDSECGAAPISVRDMIKRYNSAFKNDTNAKANYSLKHARANNLVRHQSQHLLPASKDSCCCLNNFASQMAVGHEDDNTAAYKNCCKNCSACTCCQNKWRKQLTGSKMSTRSDSVNSTVSSGMLCKDLALKCASIKNGNKNEKANVTATNTRSRLHSTDSADEVNCHTIESFYQSKTTIAKTANGVRIIIDIYFDQEQCVNATDVIGSRVETDIPHSRILSEFQQQSLSASQSLQKDNR